MRSCCLRGFLLSTIILWLSGGMPTDCLADAAGRQYVEAYNVLVRMLNDRQRAVNRSTYDLKDAGNGDGVTQEDLNFLRGRVRDLMSSAFLLGPGCADLSCFDDFDTAFPRGLRLDADGDLIEPSLMTSGGFEIGKNGRFTKIPPEFHGAGTGIYADNFTDVPMLWIHFRELHEALRRLRYTRRTGHWQTEYRAWAGCGGSGIWSETVVNVTAAIMNMTPPISRDPPRNTTNFSKYESQWKWLPPSFSGDARLYRGEYVVDAIADVGSPSITFHYFATHRPQENEVWGTTGEMVANRWTPWCTMNTAGADGICRSASLGDTELVWCDEPVNVGDRHRKGNFVVSTVAIIDWGGLYSGRIVNPEFQDTEDDGLVATGCECKSCPPGADPDFQAMCADPSVTFPLGLSSGLAEGNLRVKAYITESEQDGNIRQMFSLDTQVLLATHEASADEQWGFVSVKRPGGAEVLFALRGERAGMPVNTGNSYRLVEMDGYFELRFPEQQQIVHRFGSDGSLVEVRAVVEHEEVSVSGDRDAWPGMEISRDDIGLICIDTAILKSYPQYSAGLVQSVEYRDGDDQPVYGLNSGDLPGASSASAAPPRDKAGMDEGIRLAAAPAEASAAEAGERRFVSYNAVGQAVSEMRVLHTDNTAEIWSGVSTNGGLRVMRKQIHSEEYDAARNRTTRFKTVVYDDGAAIAGNVTADVIGTFAWGSELVSHIEGYGADEQQTTAYAYYTNALDAANYARLKSVARPNGYWQRYEYDAAGRIVREVSPFKNSPPDSPAAACRVVSFVYAGDATLPALGFPAEDVAVYPDHRPRLTVETVLGHEVARTYDAYLPTGHVTKRCAVPGAPYNHHANLVRTTCVYTNGPARGRVKFSRAEDGRLTTYDYEIDEDRNRVTKTATSGWAGAHDVASGVTVTTTVTDSGGRRLRTTMRDADSGIVFSDIRYELDAFGRATMTSNAVTGRTTGTEYGCCGADRETAHDGRVTSRTYDRLNQVVSVTEDGVTTYYTRDALGNVTATLRMADGESPVRTCSTFDALGRVTSTTNALGHGTTYAYHVNDAGGQVTTTRFPDGGTHVAAAYRDGRAHAVTGTAVHAVCYDYGVDANGLYTLEYAGADTNAAQWVRSCLDMLGRVSHTVTSGGYTNRFTYDSYGREVCRDDGFTMRLTGYSDAGEAYRTAIDMNRNGVIDPAGPDRVQEAASAYTNWNGRLVRVSTTRAYVEAGSDTPATVAWSYTALDGAEAWSISFGRTNHQITALDAARVSRCETRILPDGTSRVSLYTNNLLRVQAGLDSDGKVISAREYDYDSFGRMIEMREPAAGGQQRTSEYRYDSSGGMTAHVVRCGELVEVTRFEYDAMGRRVATIHPDGGRVEQTYSARGELLSQSGARTYPVAYTYTSRGQAATLSTFRNGETGAADVTTWEYDVATGMLVSKRYADGSRVSYDHYANGAVRTRTWARGVETRYAYDAAGAVTNVTYSDGTAAVRYEWDRQGRNTAVVDAAGRLEMTYSPAGQLLTASRPADTSSAVDYTFDRLARLSAMAMPHTSTAQTYGYDAAGRLATVSDGRAAFTYSYGADGGTVTGLTAVSSGAAVLTSRREFDGLGRLTRTSAEVGGATATSHAYTYNAAGQRTGQTLTDGSYWEYAYDDRGQLISGKKTFSDGIPVYGAQFEYEYDSIGNRKSSANDYGPATRRTTYAANALNQYTGITHASRMPVTGHADADAQVWVAGSGQDRARLANRHGTYFWSFMQTGDATIPSLVTNTIRVCAVRAQAGATNCLVARETRSTLVPPAVQAFSHDADGNLLCDGVYTNTWDAENRLVKTETLAAVPADRRFRVENTYDYLGRRIRKTHLSDWSDTSDCYTATNITTYVWDGWNIIAEMSNAGYTNRYTYGLDLSGTLQGAGGVGGALAMTHHSTNRSYMTYFYTFDGNGNVVNLVDASDGSIAATYEYSPFGQPLRATGPMATPNPVRWSTKHTDDETDLVMYPKRPYAPTWGRFATRDPIAESGGLNLFGFVHNAPANAVDAIGLALYAFDGTANVPDDETNVYLTYHSGWGTPNAHYEKGIGNEDEYSFLTAIPRQATGWGLSAKRSSMLAAMERFLEAGDADVDIIGFSRGAVTAITFAEAIEKLKEEEVYPYCLIDRVRFMGLYDPVPGPFIRHRPGIPGIVKRTAIAYSLDEKRHQFAQSMYSGGGVTALGFRGGHSDVGGGYQQRGLANISLEWMIDQGLAAGAPFKYPTPSKSPKMVRHQEINYHLYLYTNRRGLDGVRSHSSVPRLIAGPVDSVVRTPRLGLDVTPYTYYLDSVAPGNDEYRVGDGRF